MRCNFAPATDLITFVPHTLLMTTLQGMGHLEENLST